MNSRTGIVMRRLGLLCGLFGLCSVATAQAHGLESLHTVKPGVSHRVSSSSMDLALNGDFVTVGAGESVTLADLNGPGMITRFWTAVSSAEPGHGRLVVVRMFWDGEQQPSVEAPLGDFFAVGHGEQAAVDSALVQAEDGRGRVAYWPMPFREGAVITVTNEGTMPVDALYYQVDWRDAPDLAADTAYFHASYRQAHPTTAGEPYVVADIAGRGHYVGTVLNVRKRESGWWGEGDEFFYVDGESYPSLRGTDTAQYFEQAHGMKPALGPYAGVTVSEGVEPGSLYTGYRWHVPDPVVFRRSLRLEFEHKGYSGSLEYQDRADDYSSVAFWYQQEPHEPFPPMPVGYDRLYFGSAIEGVLQSDADAEEKEAKLLDYLRASAVHSSPLQLNSESVTVMHHAVRVVNPTAMTASIEATLPDHNGLRAEPSELSLELPPRSERWVNVALTADAPRAASSMNAFPTFWEYTYQPEFAEATATRVRHFLKWDTEYDVVRTHEPKAVDGELNDWQDLPVVARAPQQVRVEYKFWEFPDDCSMRFGVVYDDSFVYIGVEVTDDGFMLSPMPDPWWQDGIEIRLDARPVDVRANWSGPAGEFDEFFFAALTPVERGTTPIAVAPEKLPEGTQYACVRTDRGYNAEVAIPVSYLEDKQDGDWDGFRLNIALDDLDSPSGPFAQIWWKPDWRYEQNYAGSGSFVRK